LQREQIAAHSGVEHIARIGQHLDRRRCLLEIVGSEAPAADNFTCRFISTSRMAERPAAASRMSASLGRFVHAKRVGARKLDKEQVVLIEVVTKGRFGKRTVSQPVRERMLGIGPPLGGCGGLQTLEEAMFADLQCTCSGRSGLNLKSEASDRPFTASDFEARPNR
jgi:hypothetical protein